MLERKLVSILALCLALSLSGALRAAAQAETDPGPRTEQPAGTPRLELSPTEFNFGEVWVGALVKREFTVKNVGDAPLEIQKVKSSCGCAVATQPKSPLEPGESSTFSITYDTKRLGSSRKKVTVISNDPTQTKTVIRVAGRVKPVFEGRPNNHLRFDKLDVTSVETKSIRLVNQWSEPLYLKLVEDQNPGVFDVELLPITPGQEFELKVTTKPPLKLGRNRITVVLATGLEQMPLVKIPVSGNAQPRVFTTPMKLYVLPKNTERSERTLEVNYRTHTPVKVVAVKASLPTIQCAVLPTGPVPRGRVMASIPIRVELPAYDDFPEEGAKLYIYTDATEEVYQELSVPVYKRTTRTRRMPPGHGRDESQARRLPKPRRIAGPPGTTQPAADEDADEQGDEEQ